MAEKRPEIPMFLVSEERLKHFSPPVRILLLAIALVCVSIMFYMTFYEAVYKILMTDEPRVGADYAAFILGCCNILVIVTTAFRFLRHSAEELTKKNQ